MMGLGRALCLMTLLALAGCSVAAPPTLPGLDGITEKTLTPEEQQAKIKALVSAQAAAGATVQPAVLQEPATN